MRQYLVVANQTLGGKELAAALQELMNDGPCRFHLVVPITQTQGSDHAVDGPWAPLEVRDGYQVGRRLAEGRLRHELTRLRESRREDADGEVVDACPSTISASWPAGWRSTRSSSPHCPAGCPVGCAWTCRAGSGGRPTFRWSR